MSGQRRCVVVVGGSHSVHVKVPARMLRAAGYRVVLADMQSDTAADATDVFDAVYSLNTSLQQLALHIRQVRPACEVSSSDQGEQHSITIETPTRPAALTWRLVQGYLRARPLMAVIRREHPGVIHVQSMTSAAMTIYYLLRRMEWPVPSMRPGLLAHLWGYAPRFPAIRQREIRVLREFDHVHTSSPAVARIYREHYDVPPSRTDVFVRGINLRTFAPRPAAELAQARRAWGIPVDAFVMIHNRHLHPMYCVDLAVEAFITLAQRGHPIFLALVRGSMCQADYERALITRISQAGLGRRVALLPPVLTADQMAVALQLCQCSVNCVPFDAFPVSILEAMFCRAVPVVRNLESYAQFVRDGETAFAVEAQPTAYVAAIERLILHPHLRSRMADTGVQLVNTNGNEDIFRQNTLRLMNDCWHEW